MFVALSGALGACANGPPLSDDVSQQAAAAPAQAPPVIVPGPAPAARGARAAPAAPAAATTDSEPLTIERARGQCWMGLESNKNAPRDLEARSKLVEKCAAEKMQKAAAAPAR